MKDYLSIGILESYEDIKLNIDNDDYIYISLSDENKSTISGNVDYIENISANYEFLNNLYDMRNKMYFKTNSKSYGINRYGYNNEENFFHIKDEMYYLYNPLDIENEKSYLETGDIVFVPIKDYTNEFILGAKQLV